MIFAAGFGKRMGRMTESVPKPMLSLAGRPMIDHSIDLAREAGINRIVANTHYLHDRIAPHLLAHDVVVHHEVPDILDTGGGLKSALSDLGSGPALTLNPDAAWTGRNPLTQLLEAWLPDMQALLLLVSTETAGRSAECGDFSLESGKIHRKGPYLYTGAQIIRTEKLREIGDPVFSLNRYWDLLAESGPLHGLIHDGGWFDIGHPDGLARAEVMLRTGYV